MADMGQPEVFQCQETSIGWSGSPVTQELFSSTLSHALVLHPFALYFSVVGIFFSLAAWTNERLTLWPLAAAPIPLLAMLVDTSLIASAFYHLVDHEKTRQYLGGVVTMQKLGLASWLSVASAVVSLLGGWLVFLAFWERVKVDGGASVESGVGRWFLRRPQDGAFDLPLVNSGSNSAMTPVSSSTPTTDSSQMLLGVASLSGDEKDKFSSLSPSPEIEEGYTHSFSAFALQQQQHLHSAQQLQMQDFKLSGGEEDFTCPSSRVSSIGGGHRSSDSSASGSGGSSSGTASRSVSPLGGKFPSRHGERERFFASLTVHAPNSTLTFHPCVPFSNRFTTMRMSMPFQFYTPPYFLLFFL